MSMVATGAADDVRVQGRAEECVCARACACVRSYVWAALGAVGTHALAYPCAAGVRQQIRSAKLPDDALVGDGPDISVRVCLFVDWCAESGGQAAALVEPGLLRWLTARK